MNEQQKKVECFLALHHSPATLVLPNVWDVSSAMIFALEGFEAIGTTSACPAYTDSYLSAARTIAESRTEYLYLADCSP